MNSHHKDVRALLHDLHISDPPQGQYFSQLFSGKEFFKGNSNALKRLHNYAFELFGLRVPPPDPLSLKHLYQQPYPSSFDSKLKPRYVWVDSFFIIEVWRYRVFSPPLGDLQVNISNPITLQYPGLMYFEERWHPSTGHQVNVCGLETLSSSQLSAKLGRFIMDALRILKYVDTRGRRPGPVKYKKAEVFNRKMNEIYIKLTEMSGHHATQEEVADVMKISLSTLKNRIRDYNAPWPPIEE